MLRTVPIYSLRKMFGADDTGNDCTVRHEAYDAVPYALQPRCTFSSSFHDVFATKIRAVHLLKITALIIFVPFT